MTACRKGSSPSPLPDGSISIQHAAAADTIEMPISVLQDSTFVIGLMAQLSGKTSSADHWVALSVDTTKLSAYRAQYGDALLLPPSSYFLFKPMAKISAGAAISDSAQINITKETQLKGYSTYILPVIIQSVDGNTEGPAATQVLYLVFKTGKPAFVSKDGWTIAAFSSSYNTFVPGNLIDNDELNTYWTSNIAQTMPQYVTINFNSEVSFTKVNYYLPTALKYPTNGGYPTSIHIETSEDTTSWDDKGTFAGNITNNMQSLDIGVTTSRYMRFTVLSAMQYAARYDCIFISGIKLVP